MDAVCIVCALSCAQVLVLGCTPDLAQTEAALKSVMDAALPPGCTISVHLVDPLR